MRQRYEKKTLRRASMTLVTLLNEIMADYEAQGFTLTVRQLFYQLVIRNAIANDEKQYGKISRLCTNARLAGLMDWGIEDRTRAFIDRPHWDSGGEIIQGCAQQYHEDLWADQECRVFCIVEKEALTGVLQPVCGDMDIPLLADRGYPSVSVLRAFAVERIIPAINEGQHVIILHLGDHDPSGMDMSRDLRDKLLLFTGEPVDIYRIALNMNQIEEFNLPPNMAKKTDKRFKAYAAQYGTSSWELDALPPAYLDQLVRTNAGQFIDTEALEETKTSINLTKTKLAELAGGFAC